MKRITEKKVSIVGAALIAAATVAYVTCASNGGAHRITYRDLGTRIDASELTPQETKRLDEILSQEVSPCGDDVSLGESLYNPAQCPLSQAAVEFVIAMLKQDYNVEEISNAYVARYAAVKGLEIPLDGSPRLGPEKAAITIMVFSDFECPHCAKAAEALTRASREYPENVAIVYKHFPLSIHPTSELAARAGFAAQKQGKFWEMHDTLFSAQGSPLDRDRILVMALGLGMDVDQFTEDMASPEATTAIDADRRLGEKLGVHGTPAIFVNGREIEGPRELEQRIREELLRQAVSTRKGVKP